MPSKWLNPEYVAALKSAKRYLVGKLIRAQRARGRDDRDEIIMKALYGLEYRAYWIEYNM